MDYSVDRKKKTKLLTGAEIIYNTFFGGVWDESTEKDWGFSGRTVCGIFGPLIAV